MVKYALICLIMILQKLFNVFKAPMLQFRYSLELGMAMGDLVMFILNLKVMDLVILLQAVLICIGKLLQLKNMPKFYVPGLDVDVLGHHDHV